MAATRRRVPDTVGRARGTAVAASGWRETARAGEAGPFRWLGWLVGAGPPVNNAPFLFLKKKNIFSKIFSEFGVKR